MKINEYFHLMICKKSKIIFPQNNKNLKKLVQIREIFLWKNNQKNCIICREMAKSNFAGDSGMLYDYLDKLLSPLGEYIIHCPWCEK